MSSLTKIQIHVLKSKLGKIGIGGVKVLDLERAVESLKKRGLLTPEGKVTPGGIKRLEKYESRK